MEQSHPTSCKFTVYIASHNYGKFVEEAIESVLRQTTDNWELLLINDNSSDDTQDILERYRGDEPHVFFRLKELVCYHLQSCT
ncbi:MAG: glycosyltransferase family 2 protein [Bdellovibrionota bacterium]